MTTLSPPQAPRANRLSFSLRTLLLVMVLVAAATALVLQSVEIRQLKAALAAHNPTDRGSVLMSTNNFWIDVRQLARSADNAIYEVAIEAFGAGPIIVSSVSSKSQIDVGGLGQPRKTTRSSVLISVNLVKAPIHQLADKSMDVLSVLAQVRNADVSAGGPATYHIPAGKSFDELFQMQIKPGLHLRGKAVSLFDLNGESYTLMIQ